jgi:hypothetical protein
LNRRRLLLSGLGCSFLLGSSWAGSRLLASPSLGMNLVAWDAPTNSDARLWQKAIEEVYALGVRRVALVSYALVDPQTGDVLSKSNHGLGLGPTRSVMTASIQAARSLGMEVSVRPWVEIDNSDGEGVLWRGLLKLEGNALNRFFRSYETLLQDLAKFAGNSGANRFYIGSEFMSLTNDPANSPYWGELIAKCREALAGRKCSLSYAANFDEYERVPFWGALDEIGIDAYFPLATEDESEGPGKPSNAVMARNWGEILARLRSFSEDWKRPILMAEWGVVPFDGTTADPSEPQPSDTPDLDEALRAYRATLDAIGNAGPWLKGVDLWHWSVNPTEDSNYRIGEGTPIARIVQNYTRV